MATFAMLIVGLLESATGALIVPIFNQAFSEGAGQRTATLFGLERIIPDSGLAAWKTISILLLSFTLAKGFAEYFSTYLMARIGQSAVLKLRQDLYRHVLSQSASFFERHRTNYLVSRLVSSAAAIEAAVTSTIRDMLRESFTLLFFLGASFFYSWRLTLGSLLLAPIVAILTARFGTRLRNLARDSFEGSKELTDTAQEALSNQNIVKAYRGEQREAERFTTVAKRIVRANLRTARISGFAPPSIEMLGMVFVVFLLYFGQREIVSGRMNAAQFLAFLFFLFRSYDPMRKLSRLQNNMVQALAAPGQEAADRRGGTQGLQQLDLAVAGGEQRRLHALIGDLGLAHEGQTEDTSVERVRFGETLHHDSNVMNPSNHLSALLSG